MARRRRPFCLDGLCDFDELKEELTARLHKEARLTELKELIDFDHPLFYVVFGVGVGCAMTCLLRLAPTLNLDALRAMNLAISLFVCSTGVYWIFTKPAVATYGPQVVHADRVVGALLIVIGFLLGTHALLVL